MINQNLVNLDLKDKKLIYELDFHSDESYNQLAKKVGLSKQGVEYKLNNLIKKGVIKGFYPVINAQRLGFTYCRLLLTLQNASDQDKNKITNFLKNHKKVFWLFEMHGTFDLLLVIWVKNLTEFKDFREEIESKYGNFIKSKVETIATNVAHFRYRFFLDNKKSKEEIRLKETSERVRIDKKDKLILDALCNNPRTSIVNLAMKIRESPKVIAYRIKRMEKEKLIECYRPIIDYNALGFTYYKIFINLNKTSKEQFSKLKDYIESNPLVVYSVEGIGIPGDLDIELIVRSNQELFEFIKDLRNKFPKLVGEYKTTIFMNTLKVKYMPEID